jgi:hypothetical protein
MSAETQPQEDMSTKPIQEHAWLQNLVGEWSIETEMNMGPGQPKQSAKGAESVKSFGGLWAIGQGEMGMPGGAAMKYYAAMGFDVTLKEYQTSWIANVSSHLWVKSGNLSADGKVLTTLGEGPNMMGEGMIEYRDVYELVDKDHFTLTQHGKSGDGWMEFFVARYTRK